MDTSSPAKNTLPKIDFIDPKNGLEFNQEWKKLLIAAFAKADWIYIVKRLSGYSGAQTWSIQTTTGGNSQLFVVKFDQPKRLRKEYDKCMEFVVGGGLYGNPVKPEGEIFHGEGQWALMKATLAGSDQSDTLFAHLNQEGAVYFKTILENIFTNENHWRKNMRRFPIRYGAYYERLLPEHFRLEGVDGVINNAYSIEAQRLERDRAKIENDLAEKSSLVHLQNFQVIRVNGRIITLATETSNLRLKYHLSSSQSPPEEDQPVTSLYGQNPKSRMDLLQDYASDLRSIKKNKKTFDYRGIKYANPLFYLQKLLDSPGELKLATIHGDLNLRNILVAHNKPNADAPKVWLIDFADTGLGPVLLDFQWLEVQVIFWLLAPMVRKGVLPISTLIDLFKALHECNVDLIAHLNPKLETSYKVMRQIRLLAQEHLVGDWSEYYHGLTLALLGALRFRDSVTDLDEFAPRVAFFSAAIVISWAKVIPADDLKSISEILQPPPKLSPIADILSSPPHPTPVSIDPLATAVWLNHPFMLNGDAHPGSKLEVFSNEQFKVETFARENGRWEVEVPAFTQSGDYTISVHGTMNDVEPATIQLTVKIPPAIDATSIPKKIYPQQKFVLLGRAQPGANLQVVGNQQPLTETSADSTGRWKAEIVLDKPGSIELVIHDKLNKAKSAPVSVTVLKPATTAKKILLPLASGVLLFILVGATWFIPPVQSPHWLNSAWGQVCNFVPSLRQYIPFGDTTESIRAGLTRWGKIIVAASIESGPFSYINADGRFDGLDVNLVREMVRGWFGLGPNDDPEKMGLLEFKGILSSKRESTLSSNPYIAFLIGAFSHTPERCDVKFQCTGRRYFNTQKGLLVQIASPITEYCAPQLKNKQANIIIPGHSSTQKTFEDYKKECDFTIDIDPDLLDLRKEAFIKVVGNASLVYQTDKEILDFYLHCKDYNPKQSLHVISPPKENLGLEDYVIGFTKDQEPECVNNSETQKREKLPSKLKKLEVRSSRYRGETAGWRC